MVLITLVVNTVVDTGPIIFLSLAEGDEGQIDATLTPGFSTNPLVRFLNFTRIQEVTGTERFAFSPRKTFAVELSARAAETAPKIKGTLMLIDSEQEKAIEIGRQYPYPNLEYGEIMISNEFSEKLNKFVGDEIKLHIDMG